MSYFAELVQICNMADSKEEKLDALAQNVAKLLSANTVVVWETDGRVHVRCVTGDKGSFLRNALDCAISQSVPCLGEGRLAGYNIWVDDEGAVDEDESKWKAHNDAAAAILGGEVLDGTLYGTVILEPAGLID